MMLAWLILLPVAGGFAAWGAQRWHADAPRYIAIGALAADLFLAIALALQGDGDPWLASLSLPWIPQLGIALRLDLDGLSLVLVVLTLGLGVVSVITSWREITERVGLFHLSLLLTLAGVLGVFLALDLFLFFFFWELMLVPMALVIGLWGHERRIYAAIKFFLFTQGSGLLMLVSILTLVLLHWRASGILTFDYFQLLGQTLDPTVAFWIMAGFFVAFTVKLPAVPFHSWLPDAHTEAPTAGSVILAGVLLKTGGYGLLRFVLPLFPDAAAAFAPVAMTLGVISIPYGALLAFAQDDMKRLVAYSSVSHMGFVLLGVFAWNTIALQGVVVQMVAHAVSTGALFMIVGFLQERIHTRDLRVMSGLAAHMPRFAALTMVFAIASLGLPGLGNFVGEFMILLGTFAESRVMTAAAALGLVTAAIYALILIQRALHGAPRSDRHVRDLNARETAVLALLVIVIAGLGVYPQPVLDAAAGGVANVQQARAPRLALGAIAHPEASGLSTAARIVNESAR
ncbi:MAG: NADH-quinone oxidoreductase subunit M [Burkholderiales bacterium]|nr:NADH-quinone oxidoreductase subunit M [Burkholderiales bacterium]